MTVTFTAEQVAEMARLGILGRAAKHDPNESALGYPLQGVTNAPFSEPGLRRDIPSAIISPSSPVSGLALRRSEYTDSKVTILTAQTASAGTNPDDVCGTAPYPGDLKKATVTRTFGELFFGSETIKVTDAGRLTNTAEIGHRIINDPLMQSALIPDLLRQPNINTRSLQAQQLMQLGTAIDRAIAPVAIDGVSTNTGTAAERGFLREFDGLSSLIKTGYVDESTSLTAAAMDSEVVSWSADFDATVGGNNLIEEITNMVYGLTRIGERLGITGLQFRLVMDERLHRQLSYLAATTYASVRYDLTNSASSPVNRDAADIERRQAAMQNGRTLLIENRPIPVYFTSGSETTLSGGELVSDLFVVPERWSGGDITYIEYFPLDNPFATEFVAQFNSTARTVINNGLYMLSERSDGFCSQMLAFSRMRLMLDMPFLAGRIDDIQFPSYTGYRSWDPAGSSYFGGGASYFTAA